MLSASLADPLPVGTIWHTNALLLHGWTLHEKWQRLFRRFAQVVEIESAHYDETHHLHFTPDAVIAFAGERYKMGAEAPVPFRGREESDPARLASPRHITVFRAKKKNTLR